MSSFESTISLDDLGVSRANQLARIADAGLIGQGRVFLLSLEAIRVELGPRWAGRSEIVWETMHRALTERMPSPDVFIRIDDATILAAIVSVEPYDGQVRCAEVLGTTLASFLGRNDETDIEIARVSGLTGNRLSCEPVDLTAAPPPPAAGRPPAVETDGLSPESWTPPLVGRRLEAPFMSERHGAVAMHFDIVPVWRLDRGVISAYAIRRRLPARIETYSDADREAMGRGLLDHLIPLLEEYRREKGKFALIIPGSFSNCSARRPRLSLLNRCEPVQDIMRQAVIMELEGFGPGLPAGRIRETAAMLKPFFYVLTACVHDTSEAEATVNDYAFHGMAIDAGQMNQTRLGLLIKSARRRTSNVVVHGVHPGLDAAWLKGLGVSHVSYGDAAEAASGVRPDGSAQASPGPPEARRATG